jgi:hypothetical protein
MAVFARFPVHANKIRRSERSIDELIGLCRGVLADGYINDAEVAFLVQWIESSKDLSGDPLTDILFQRLADALTDGVIDEDEEADLLGALHDYIGGRPSAPIEGVQSASTRLPLCSPQPVLVFHRKSFVLTGTFTFGPRANVCLEIEQRGGHVSDDVMVGTDYLIVGGTASRDWVHSSYGRKIEKAVLYRGKGHGIAIVSEETWTQALSIR